MLCQWVLKHKKEENSECQKGWELAEKAWGRNVLSDRPAWKACPTLQSSSTHVRVTCSGNQCDQTNSVPVKGHPERGILLKAVASSVVGKKFPTLSVLWFPSTGLQRPPVIVVCETLSFVLPRVTVTGFNQTPFPFPLSNLSLSVSLPLPLSVSFPPPPPLFLSLISSYE